MRGRGVETRACLSVETVRGERLEVLLPIEPTEPVRVRLLTAGPVASADFPAEAMRELLDGIGRQLWACQAGGKAGRLVDAADRLALAAQAAATLPRAVVESARGREPFDLPEGLALENPGDLEMVSQWARGMRRD